jgi:hypothetical protein
MSALSKLIMIQANVRFVLMYFLKLVCIDVKPKTIYSYTYIKKLNVQWHAISTKGGKGKKSTSIFDNFILFL